jgi:ribonuclease HI
MARIFDEFLATYGMSMNAKKCFYTSFDPEDPQRVPPAIQIHHVDGSLRNVRYISPSEQFTYLGIEVSLDLNNWSKHLEKMETKFAEGNSRVYYSRANGEGAVKLLNQDVFSKLSYSFGPVAYSNQFRSKIQKAACKTVKHCGHLQSTVPYSCIMAPLANHNGYGLDNINVVYRSEKVKFLRSMINTSDSLSRLTALENIDSINLRMQHKSNILCPESGTVHSKSKVWKDFPAFYKEAHQLLADSGWSINSNIEPIPISHITTIQFLRPYMPKKLKFDPFRILEDENINLMKDLLPEIFDSSFIGEPPASNCQLDECLQQKGSPGWNGKSVKEFIDEVVQLLVSKLTMMDIGLQFDVPNILSRALRKALKAFLETDAFLEWKPLSTSALPCVLPQGCSSDANIACDGSFDPDSHIAALGICSQSGASWKSRIPGLQTIQRAELFGLLGALWVTKPEVSVTVFTDCLAVQSVVTNLFARRHMTKGFVNLANKSIIYQIVDLLDKRAACGLSTQVTWINAYTGLQTTIGYTLNDRADQLANEARGIESVDFTECMKFVDRFFFRNEENHLVE